MAVELQWIVFQEGWSLRTQALQLRSVQINEQISEAFTT